jgi:hypothetical protein
MRSGARYCLRSSTGFARTASGAASPAPDLPPGAGSETSGTRTWTLDERDRLDAKGTGGFDARAAPRIARESGSTRCRHADLERLAAELGVEGRRVEGGAEKKALVEQLGPERCAAIGSGRNDTEMLHTVSLGVCVLGPEGTSREAIDSADLVCDSITAAFNLLLDPRALAATLRR